MNWPCALKVAVPGNFNEWGWVTSLLLNLETGHHRFVRAKYTPLFWVSHVYLPRIVLCFCLHLVAGTEQILKIQVHSRNVVGDVE